jgi:histone deacetylase 11
MTKTPTIPLPLFLLLTLLPSLSAGMKQPCGDSLPIIYSPGYNISILGIENFHPFDSKKYKKVFNGIIKHHTICPSQLYSPRLVTEEELLTVHTEEYLASLKSSSVISRIVEIPFLRVLPVGTLNKGILKPMKLATGGTILGVELALRYGWAINLSGGYHHAKANKGEGFCVYADVPVALHSLWQTRPDRRVLIVDLDAHQGNGNSALLGNDHRVAIFDMYNSSVYPADAEALQQVTYKIPLRRRTATEEYLILLLASLPKAIGEFNPELIVYNAGTDIFMEDRLGNLSVSERGIISRDEYVFQVAHENSIPILMVLSGGYHKKSGGIIARSINNIITKFDLFTRKRPL